MAASASATHRIHSRSSQSSKASRPSITGGTIVTKIVSLIGITTAYRYACVEWAHVRVWAALVELHERHRLGVKAAGHARAVTAGRVAAELGVSEGAVACAIEDLRELGLVPLEGRVPVFPAAVAEIRDPALRRHVERRLWRVGQTLDRGVVVPRRQFARWYRKPRGGRVVFATAVALYLRLLFVSRGDEYDGTVPLRELVQFVDAPAVSVKVARGRLVGEGVFELGEQKPHDNRLRPRYRLVTDSRENIPTSVEKSAKISQLGTLPQSSSTSSNTIRAREAGGALQHRSTSDPVAENAKASADRRADGEQRRSLCGITRGDLRNPWAVQALFEVAVEQGHVRLGERAAVFALACHAVRVGRNAGALFRQGLVKDPRIRGYATAADEREANSMVSALGEPTTEMWSVVGTASAAAAIDAAALDYGTAVDDDGAPEATAAECEALRERVAAAELAPGASDDLDDICETLAREVCEAAADAQAGLAAVNRLFLVWGATFGWPEDAVLWEWAVVLAGEVYGDQIWSSAS